MTEPFADADRFRALDRATTSTRGGPRRCAGAAALLRAEPDPDAGPLRARGPRHPGASRSDGGRLPERVGPFVVPGAGHFLQWERADLLNGALRWLSVPRAPRSTSRVAEAFHVATTAAPRATPSRLVEANVTSATRLPGPRAEPHAVASSVIDAPRPRAYSRRAGAPPAPTARPRSPGETLTQRRRSGSVLETVPPPSRPTMLSPSGPGAGCAREHHRAGEVRHEGRPRGAPRARWACPPGPRAPVDHAHAVAEQGRLREVVGHEQRRHLHLGAPHQLARRARRGCASRARRAARRAAARPGARQRRARATRWRSPPDSVPGRASASCAIPKRSQQLERPPATLSARQLAQRVGRRCATRSGERTARAPGRGTRSAAARGRGRVRGRCRARSRRRSAPRRARGAAARRRRARCWSCPAPDGPASARHGPRPPPARRRAPERLAGSGPQRGARPGPPRPPTSFAASRIAADTATSTAESARPRRSRSKRS